MERALEVRILDDDLEARTLGGALEERTLGGAHVEWALVWREPRSAGLPNEPPAGLPH